MHTEVGRTRGYQGAVSEPTEGRHLCFWHGRDRGQSSNFLAPSARCGGIDGLSAMKPYLRYLPGGALSAI